MPIGVYFLMIFGGLWFWQIGCWICCALVVSSPVGALACRFWARRHGLDAARCTRLGALYWAVGFMPWLYFSFQINGWSVPPRLIKAIYAALFSAWLMGPVIFGFFWTSENPLLGDRDWLVLHPIGNLLACIVALICLLFARVLPARSQRVDIRHVAPSALGSLAMLTWLPHFLYFYFNIW